MSSETSKWLNQNVLIGMTDQRGTAWHYRATDQGDEPNHYPGPIPIDDVERRLFDWEAIVVPSYWGKPVRDENGKIQYDSDGIPIVMAEPDPDRVYVIASDTDERFATFTDTYTPHQYRPWLLGNVAKLLDDDLVISSAGLLDKRGIAWVEVSMPETQETAGVRFRPNMLATTSFNGKVATTYARTITAVVCDNTHTAALNEAGAKYRVKHTKNSGMRVMEAREALEIIWSTTDEMSDAINRLTDATLTESQWEIPSKDDDPRHGDAEGRHSGGQPARRHRPAVALRQPRRPVEGLDVRRVPGVEHVGSPRARPGRDVEARAEHVGVDQRRHREARSDHARRHRPHDGRQADQGPGACRQVRSGTRIPAPL